MQFTKSPPALVEAFDAVMPGAPAVRKLMFGYPAAFVNGNMFMGLFGDGMFLRLGEDDRAELLRMKGASVFAPMAGRPMREYIVVPPALVADKVKLRRWVGRALEYGSSLPAKKKKPKDR